MWHFVSQNFFGVSEVFFINDLHLLASLSDKIHNVAFFFFKVEKFSGGREPPTIVLNEQRRS